MEMWVNGEMCLVVKDFLLFIKTTGLNYIGFDYGVWVLSEVPAFWNYSENGHQVCTKG